MSTKSEEKDLVVMDRKVLRSVIAEIEENLDILESLMNDEMTKEAERRMKEIKEEKVTPIEEEEIYDLLECD
ncbi:MAG: hypothetical protein U9N35_01645 [Euryarchaeota archaeon]|nr:hypothetical protein [Euryarchaeota archaeon]